MSPHPSPPVAYNCCVSVFLSTCRIDPTTLQLITEICTCIYASTSATGWPRFMQCRSWGTCPPLPPISFVTAIWNWYLGPRPLGRYQLHARTWCSGLHAWPTDSAANEIKVNIPNPKFLTRLPLLPLGKVPRALRAPRERPPKQFFYAATTSPRLFRLACFRRILNRFKFKCHDFKIHKLPARQHSKTIIVNH